MKKTYSNHIIHNFIHNLKNPKFDSEVKKTYFFAIAFFAQAFLYSYMYTQSMGKALIIAFAIGIFLFIAYFRSVINSNHSIDVFHETLVKENDHDSSL